VLLNYIQPAEKNTLENKEFLNVKVAQIASFLLETGTWTIIVIAYYFLCNTVIPAYNGREGT
jgi:hypothetical protein